jgi:hypothetical protein
MKYLLFTILLLIGTLSLCQAQDKPLVQFSGRIYNRDTNVVVPNVTIYNKSNGNRAFSANYQGYFSFVVHEGDTIIFESIGYQREALVIPSNLLDKKYTVIVVMKPTTYNLPLVTILPWANIDEFNRDFMTMKFADDDLEIARKNVSRDKIMAMSKTLYRDAGEIQSLNFQNNHISLGNKNMNLRGANPLLNPFAWGALMKQILEGDKSREN